MLCAWAPLQADYLQKKAGLEFSPKKIAKLNSCFYEQQQEPLKVLGTLLGSLAGTAVGFRFFFYGRGADGKRW